jgi:hypothetical protein
MRRDRSGSMLVWALAATAPALGLTGCSSSPSQVGLAQGCSINSDCDAPLICAFTRCHSACTESRDCPTGQRCVLSGTSGVCQLPAESTCSAGTMCVSPLVCAPDEQCRNACQTAQQCVVGQSCTSDACFDAIEIGSDGGSDASAPDAQAGDGNAAAIVTLATAQANPLGIAVDGENLYWTTDQGVMAMPLAGGAPMLLASSPGGNSLVRSDGANVFWTSQAQGTVSRVAIGGGPVAVLAMGQNAPLGIALDASTVYFTSAMGTFSVPKLGGMVTQISGGSGGGIVTDGTNVYWVNPTGGEVSSSPGQELVAEGQMAPTDITIDALNLYWTNAHGTDSVVKLPLSSLGPSTPPIAIASNQPSPERIATDGVSVYWANAGCPGGECTGAGSIAKVAVAGGSVVIVAAGQSGPTSVAVDGTFVYWASTGDAAVKKTLK